MNAADLALLRRALVQANATWIADYNPLIDLAPELQRLRLGAVPPAGEKTLVEREAHAAELLKTVVTAPAVPTSADWRSHAGQNYICCPKDQGGCGSCVAFGTAATIDGAMRVIDAAPIGTAKGYTLQDVSEAQLYYCSKTASDAHTCETGWWPTSALAYAHATGLAPESCFPYTAGDQPCNVCKNWQSLVTKVGNTSSLTTANAMQQWLATKGPLITCFTVYDDFFAYSSGVYTHHSGAVAGGHCVCCIGYNLTTKAWLCKNSWGASWGMGGYFWIGFGQCGIDSDMWGISSFTTIYHT